MKHSSFKQIKPFSKILESGNSGLIPFMLFLAMIIAGSNSNLKAQAPEIPIPVETFFGHNDLYYQITAVRQFSPESRFGFFGLATFTADYKNEIAENRIITIAQVDYEIGKGFALMGGMDMNSVSGFAPIIGPKFSYASKKWLAVTTVSYFLNEESDVKLFGLYEYTPQISDNWSFYSRLQFIVNQSLSEKAHNKSYLYLRAGAQKGRLIFGMAANLDWSGPNKIYGESYGPFVRWEF